MPVIIASVAFMLFAYIVGRADYATYLGIPHVPGAGDLTILLGAIIGAGLAFLWFNAPPAAVFMGDTGSLALRSEEHTSELQSLMRISYAVFCLKKKQKKHIKP